MADEARPVPLTPAQRLKIATIISKVADLDVTTDYLCPFECGASRFLGVGADHAPDCPITYARELQAFGREIETDP